VAKGLALGANDYITKPFSTKELVQKVRELLAPMT
jgi:DNA-binding response OmpR family regulator